MFVAKPVNGFLIIFVADEVEINEPKVNCEVVAMIFVPALSAVKIELAPKLTVAVKVPDVVTGEFVIVKAVGKESPTEVTVPDPEPPPVHVLLMA